MVGFVDMVYLLLVGFLCPVFAGNNVNLALGDKLVKSIVLIIIIGITY